MAQINQLTAHTLGDSLDDAHKAASRMEARLGQLLSDLTGECSGADIANGRPPGLNASASDLVNRLHSIASQIERVQELVTGNPDAKQVSVRNTLEKVMADRF